MWVSMRRSTSSWRHGFLREEVEEEGGFSRTTSRSKRQDRTSWVGGGGVSDMSSDRDRVCVCVCVLPGWRRPQSCTGVWITPHKEPRLCWTDAALQAAKDTNTDTHTYHHHPMPDTTLSVCVCMFLPCWARYGADSELPACSSPVCGGHWRGGRGEGGGTGEVRVLGGSPAPKHQHTGEDRAPDGSISSNLFHRGTTFCPLSPSASQKIRSEMGGPFASRQALSCSAMRLADGDSRKEIVPTWRLEKKVCMRMKRTS